MKKKLLVLSVLALSGISTATLASCDKFAGSTTVTPSESIQKTVTGISVTGQNTEYGIGDSIVQGAGARVSVNYSDGTSSDSTATAKFDFSAVDATKAGTYTVKVTCQGKETSYNVTVKEYVFDGIEVDTTNAKLDYYLFTIYDFSDVIVNALYKHPVTNEVTKKVLNNADVAFNVTDKDGNTITSQFPAFGAYKVEASYNNAKTSFNVNCVPVDAKTLEEAITAASNAESSVNTGNATHVSQDYDDNSTITTSTDYKYGESFVVATRLVSINDGGGTENKYRKENLYYSLDYNGKIFVVAVPLDDNGNELKNEAYIPNDIENLTEDDAKFAGFNIFTDGTKYNGLYTTISNFYKEVADNVVGDLKTNVGKCEHLDNADGFAFSYNRLNSSYNQWYFQKVIVEFTLSESGAINKAYIKIDDYISEENPAYGEKDYEAGTPLPSDLPIEIKTKEDEAGQTKKYFVFKDGVEATPSRGEIWTFNQETGLKVSDEENPYLADKVKMSAFDIKDADGNVLNDGDTINIDLDNGNVEKDEGYHRFVYNFTLDNILPETALANVDLLSFVVTGTGKDGYELGSGDSDSAYAYANKNDSGFTIMFNRPGDYDIVIKSLNVTKTLHYHVDYEAPYTIAGTVHNGEGNSSFVPEDSFAMYKSNKIYIGANIGDPSGNNPTVFEPGFEAVVDKATGHLEKTTVNVNGKDVECYAFTATEAGDYVITLTGAKPDSDRAAATTQLTINVSENPTLAEILAKYDNKYEAVVSENEIYSLEFTDNKFTVYSKYDRTKYAEYDYTYDADTRTFSCIPGKSAGIDKTFELTMSNYYVLSLFDTDEKKNYVLTKPTSDITDEDLALLNGTYKCSVMNGMLNYTFKFTSGEEKGTGSLIVSEDQGTGSPKNYEYTYEFDAKTRKLVPSYVKGGPLDGHDIKINSESKLIYSSAFGDVELEKEAVDYTALFTGEYTINPTTYVNGSLVTMTQHYVFLSYDNTTKTGRFKFDQGNSTKYGNYKFEIDSSGNITTEFEKETNRKDYFKFKLVIKNNSLYVNAYENDWLINSTDTPEEPEIKEIPEEYIGTWYGVDSYDDSLITVVISSTSIKVTSEGVNQTFEVQSLKNNIVTAGKLVLTLENNSIGYDYNKSYITCILSKENPLEALEVPSELQGTYVGYNPDASEKVTIIIDKETIIYKTAEDEFSYNLKSVNESTYIFTDESDYSVKFVVGSDGTITFTNENDLSFVISVKTEETPIEIDNSYVGIWKNDEDTITLVIDSSSVSWNDIPATGLAYEDGWLVFNVESYGNVSVKYNEQNGKLDMTYSGRRIELTKQTSDTPAEDVDYKGTYVNDEYYNLFVGAENVIFDGDQYTIKSTNKENDVETVVASMTQRGQEKEITITIENGVATINIDDDDVTFEKNGEYIAIPDSFKGVWLDENENSLTISSDIVIFDNGTETVYFVISASDTELKVSDSYGDLEITYTLSDGKLVEDDEYEYTKSN